MKPSSAKAKGRRLAQWLKGAILGHYPSLGEDDIGVTSSGTTGEDITLSPAARGFVPFQFECKNRKAFAICRDYEQATSHGTREPALVIKENRGQPLVLVRATIFLELLKGYNKNGTGDGKGWGQSED